MKENGQYTPKDLEQDIVKQAEALDREQTRESLEKMTEGRQNGYSKADCEDIVAEQK